MYKIGFKTATGRRLGFDGPYSSQADAEVCLKRWGYVQRVLAVGVWVEPSSGQRARVLVDLAKLNGAG